MSSDSTRLYKDQLQNYYSDKAGEKYKTSYTGKGRYRSNYFRLQLVNTLLDSMQPKPKLVLEAGCGDARVVAEIINRGFPCLGFDYNPSMLEIGAKVLHESGIDPSIIKQGDIYEIPYDDTMFDAVLCMGVLSNIPNHQKVFQEFQRVLKPNGRVVFSVSNELFSLFSMNKHTLKFYEALFQETRIDPSVQQTFLDALAKGYDVDAVKVLDKPIQEAEIDKSSVEIGKYNPLNLGEKLDALGFEYETVRYYHYHPIPPRFEKDFPEIFAEFAETLETTEYDWKGAVLCNAMVVQARMKG